MRIFAVLIDIISSDWVVSTIVGSALSRYTVKLLLITNLKVAMITKGLATLRL